MRETEREGSAERGGSRIMDVTRRDGSTGVSTRSTGSDGPGLEGLRALILLAGAVRPTPLIAGTDRAVLDLPVNASDSLMDLWCSLASDLVGYLEQPSLDVRVLANRTGPCPREPRSREGLVLSIEREPSELRGTGGILRDATVDYDDDDFILVVNATKVPLGSLVDELEVLERVEGAVRIVAQLDGAPSGIMLVRCRALRQVPEVGFIDMKEQALPIIAESEPVVVTHHDAPTADPVRSLGDYIRALRAHHLKLREEYEEEDPFTEVWKPVFSVIEEGAKVDSSAVIHDGVVLGGGHVEAGATLVRSVVCPGGRVGRNSQAIDELVVPKTEKKQLQQMTRSLW
jgi:mannose-1-phosphate guanylyltransferase